ncbi:DUF1152 domain-containing protein [Streptomyces sp. NBC_00631]|uniref:DUF1152 domain-containing protein n=1 Tax=Streptomyces sp. NBC_00631 TaxID=2975793 RepID=UPI00386881D5
MRQLEELVAYLRPTSIAVLDVGGEVLARGDEPTLKSPLVDSLTLTACGQVNVTVRLLTAGPGLDDELSHEDPRAAAASMPVASEGCHSRTEPIGCASSAVKAWTSGPSMPWRR